MPLLFIDYTNLVVKAYREKRDANQLSQLLVHPTNANIRQEFLNIYNERTRRGAQVEENTLRSFFGVPPAGRNLDYVIERFDTDRFRPLQSFIRGEIKNPAVITVELLAWLIDFTPRPLGNAQNVFRNTDRSFNTVSPIGDSTERQDESNNAGTKEEEKKKVLPRENTNSTETLLQDQGTRVPVMGNEDESKTRNFKQRSNYRRLKIIAGIGLVIAIFFGGIYVKRQYEGFGNIPFANMNTGCMYWDNDHYEQAPCSEQQNGRLILPLNEEKKDNFKRITREDTITERSINLIYYISVNGKIEYYTQGGNHPVYVTRTLKKLSPYMFNNHLLKKEAPGNLNK